MCVCVHIGENARCLVRESDDLPDTSVCISPSHKIPPSAISQLQNLPWDHWRIKCNMHRPSFRRLLLHHCKNTTLSLSLFASGCATRKVTSPDLLLSFCQIFVSVFCRYFSAAHQHTVHFCAILTQFTRPNSTGISLSCIFWMVIISDRHDDLQQSAFCNHGCIWILFSSKSPILRMFQCSQYVPDGWIK